MKVSHACTFLQDAYFQQTSRVQKMVLPFQIVTNDTSLCQPGLQERSADIEGKQLVKLLRAHSAYGPPACLASLRCSCSPTPVPVGPLHNLCAIMLDGSTGTISCQQEHLRASMLATCEMLPQTAAASSPNKLRGAPASPSV